MKPKHENEAKRQKFLRLAEERTNKILQKIRVLGNCSNRGQYEYTTRDVQDIFKAIKSQLAITQERFEKSSPNDRIEFSFRRD